MRCPLNVPGPFYTCGECLACDAPEAEAPELLAPLTDDNYTTYFVRQPSTPEEVERACNAIRVCCVGDLRYGGTDPGVIEQLGNTADHSDYVLVEGQPTFVGISRAGIVAWLDSLWRWASQSAGTNDKPPSRDASRI